MKTYITYGFKIDDIKNIKTDLRNSGVMKPKSALWGSPIDAEYGWKEWCESEHYIPGNKKPFEEYADEYFGTYFTWTLKEGSKVYTVSNMEDIEKLESLKIIYKDTRFYGGYTIDFIEAYNQGYCAVELTDPCMGHRFYNELEMLFNSWDCESIVVLDPSKIILLETQ